MKAVISAFVSKLVLYRRDVERGEFYQFSNFSFVKKRDEDILTYCQHLEALHDDFNNQFHILNMKIPDWILDPFSNTELELPLQEELSTNEELKLKFVKSGYQDFKYR